MCLNSGFHFLCVSVSFSVVSLVLIESCVEFLQCVCTSVFAFVRVSTLDDPCEMSYMFVSDRVAVVCYGFDWIYGAS